MTQDHYLSKSVLSFCTYLNLTYFSNVQKIIFIRKKYVSLQNYVRVRDLSCLLHNKSLNTKRRLNTKN